MPPPMIRRSHFLQQVLDHGDLVADLGAAQDGDVRMLRILGRLAQVLQLLFHQEAGDRRQVSRHALGAGMRAVGRAEGVVDVDLAQGRPAGLAKSGSFFSSSLWKRTFSSIRTSPGLSALAIASTSGPTQSGAILTGLLEQLAQRLGRRLQAELRIRAALRPAQVAHQDQRGALLQDVLDGGQRGADALVVRDRAVLHRDVEVDAHQDALALEIDVANGLLVHGIPPANRPPAHVGRRIRPERQSVGPRASWPSGWPGRPCGPSSPTRCRTRRRP